MGCSTRVVCAVVVCLLIALTAMAADLKRSMTDAEGRKRAAENGARSIRTTAPAQLEEIRSLFSEAAAAHNEWLDATSSAINQGAISDAINSTAEKAAASLVKWVAARNAALGEPILAGALATSSQAWTRQGLLDIAVESVRRAKGGNATKKADIANDLNGRLRWKTWDQL